MIDITSRRRRRRRTRTRAGVPRLRAVQARAGAVRRLGLPPGQPGGPGGERVEVPRARPACSRSRTSAAGRRSTTSSSIPTNGLDREDRGGRGSLDGQVSTPPDSADSPPPARGRRRSRERRGGGRPAARVGIATLWLSLIVLLPLAAVVAKSLEGGLGAFWDAVIEPPGRRALRFTLLVSLAVARDQRGDGHADRLGARARRASAASASSTR